MWIEGTVERVVWTSPDGGYGILVIQTGKKSIPAVGDLAVVAEEGKFLSLEGDFESHPSHGRQFRVQGFLEAEPRTLDGLRAYLASARLPGVGPKTAERMVDAFGLETLQILDDDPDRLAELPRMSSKKAAAIAEAWAELKPSRSIAIMLRGFGLGARIIEQVEARFGSSAIDVVRRTPYLLVEEIRGVGFLTADRIARSEGLADDAPERVRAAVLHSLRHADGHVYLPLSELGGRVHALGVPTEHLQSAVEGLVRDARIVEDEHGVYDHAMYLAELAVAQRLGEMALQAEPDPAGARSAAEFAGVTLDETQLDAVAVALGAPVCVITGGPGTGKTTLTRVLIRATEQRGESWALVSPTGRAARRLQDATQRTATTIHRLLEYNPGEGGFQRHEANPLELDGVLVDEASMVDLKLMYALIRALPPGAQLVLVGDVDQLPSVGAGQVLRDVIRSEVVPVVRLQTIYRQGEGSGIVRASRQVLQGHVPDRGEEGDFFEVARSDPERAAATLEVIVAQRLPARGLDPIRDVQVLLPMRKGPMGTIAVNKRLQQALNPHGAEVKRGDLRFRQGDRVMCVRNRHDLEIYNGDVGWVTHADNAGLRIDFDGRVVDWTPDDFKQLDLAYAVTIHKSQGSEYPAVVLGLVDGHHIMLERRLFYTAVTRARNFLCLLGSPSAWRRAASTQRTGLRHTALAERIRSTPPPIDLLDG